MYGIVTAIKHYPNPKENIYSILTEDGTISTENPLLLELNDKVEIDGLKQTGKATKQEYDKALQKALRIAGLPKPHAAKHRSKDLESVLEKMDKKLRLAAVEIAKRCLTGTPVVFRFHNDCDGSSGAVAIYNAIEDFCGKANVNETNMSWRMNKGVSYLAESFHSDSGFFNSFSSIEKPLVFITDFGTSEESNLSIGLCKDKYELVWIDHHPIGKEFDSKGIGNYINSWNFDGNSDCTAGFISCCLAELIAPVDAEVLKEASLIGDYSEYADTKNKQAYKLAMTLDYLTGKSGSAKITPRQISEIISNKESLDENFAQASSLLNDAIDSGVNRVKRYRTKDGISVFVLDFKSVKNEEADYPLPGRYSSWLQDRLEETTPGHKTITMVYHGSYVSVRIAKSIAEKLDLIHKIEGLKKSSDYIQSVGGHHSAFSIKTEKQNMGSVIGMVLNAMGATS